MDSDHRDRFEELRSAFTAVVSHELRTPLARLLALVEDATLPDGDPHAALERVRDEVVQMSQLVDEVLFLSQLETGREVVALRATEAAPVIRAVVSELAERSERAGVRLEVEIEDETLELPLRSRMLRTVVENLAENALRYAGEGATCTLSLRREDGAIVFAARDDGAGVPPEHLPRLFERFYRGDRARTTRGTGLGLAIVKHVVESAGGTVEARTPAGGGLDIRCAFPS